MSHAPGIQRDNGILRDIQILFYKTAQLHRQFDFNHYALNQLSIYHLTSISIRPNYFPALLLNSQLL